MRPNRPAHSLALLTLLLAFGLAAAEPPPVTAEEYAARRARVAEAIGPDALLILESPEPAQRNGDVSWPFRQDDDLYYLTGVAEPASALVMMPGEEGLAEVLFAPDRDSLSEAWDGPIPEHAELAAVSGVAEVHSSGGARGLVAAALNGTRWGASEIYRYYRPPAAPHLREAVVAGRATVWLDLGTRWWGASSPALDMAQAIRAAWPEVEIRDVAPLLFDLREVKSAAEVAHVEHAIEITEAAIAAGMERALSAETENQVAAAVESTFLDRGACCWAFPSIVAAGSNTTILHYPAGRAPVPRDGLVMLDVGADYRGYAADVTRTFPADGTFSPEQRAIYDAVHGAWAAMLPKLTAGNRYVDVHLATLDYLAERLLALGLVTAAEREQAEMYFFHGLGHPLGLQTHDEFDRLRDLEPGMIWSLEPGVYVRPADVEASAAFQALDAADQEKIRAALDRYAGIGVRIEDDVLITDGAPRVLSDGAPRGVEEIEAAMAAMAAMR